MRDHVVELARDASLLLRGGALDVGFAFALQSFGFFLELVEVGATCSKVVAEHPGSPEEGRLA